MEFITQSPEETKKLGRKIANNLVGSGLWTVDSERVKHRTPNTENSNILALTGDLGSGKTTFLQGFASGLGIEQRVISPTFILMRKYQILPNTLHRSQYTDFYHIDLYRLEENVEQEVKNLGIEEIWFKKNNIVAIEWAEKIKQMLGKDIIWVKFENLREDKRKLLISNLAETSSAYF